MRFFVCSGMERAAGELFSAAETVPGVSPSCSAIVFRVTLFSLRRPGFFLGVGLIYRILQASFKRILQASSKIGIREPVRPSRRDPRTSGPIVPKMLAVYG